MTKDELLKNLVYFEDKTLSLIRKNLQIIYVPLHLNNFIVGKYLGEYNKSRVFENSGTTYEFLYDLVKAHPKKLFVIDFLGIDIQKSIFEKFHNFNNTVYVNVCLEIFNEFNKEQRKGVYQLEGSLHEPKESYIITHLDLKKSFGLEAKNFNDYYCKCLGDLSRDNKVVGDKLVELLEKFCIEKVKSPIRSSNVVANMYVRLEKIFTKPNDLNILMYYFTMLIYFNIHSKEEHVNDLILISASPIGACLANMVKLLLKNCFNCLVKNYSELKFSKKYLHLLKVGPQLSSLKNPIDFAKYKRKKFIYIFDFMCLGAERNLIKAILDAGGAKLTASYGIAHYKKALDESGVHPCLNIHTLIDIAGLKNGKYEIKTEESNK